MTNTSDPTNDQIDLASPYPLGPGTARRFEEQGFVRLSGVLSRATATHFEPVITAKVIELNTMRLSMAERDTYQKAFLQVTNLWEHSEVVRQLVDSPRLTWIAAELMGVDGVRLYYDQALYKETGGGLTPWHADQYYWPFSTDRCCTARIPLQDTPIEMGPLTFAVGSHGFEWPRSGDTPRRVMTIIYLDADMTVATPVNAHQASDLGWLLGTEPGDVPDTPLNPVLYRAAAH